jgi:Ni,Fe-hydrogenase I small subunit
MPYKSVALGGVKCGAISESVNNEIVSAIQSGVGDMIIREPMTAVYEGKGIIRLRGRPPQLQKEQELLVTIVPIPVEYKVYEAQPSPREYFCQIVSDLCHYEQKYSMTSEEFYQQFQGGDLQEGPFDYFDWRVLYDGYRHMQERFGFIR